MALKLSELMELVVAGVKVAVMPVGSADVDRATAELKPFVGTTVMTVAALAVPF